MSNFGKLEVGSQFHFHGSTYTKIDETTAVAIQSEKEKVHFFTSNDTVEEFVDN